MFLFRNIVDFNSHLSARGYGGKNMLKPQNYISIHASLREATLTRCHSLWISTISIHASLREATEICSMVIRILRISIHASLREATTPSIPERVWFTISIHASLREATGNPACSPSNNLFQFTPLCERLRSTAYLQFNFPYISIHASLREATGN